MGGITHFLKKFQVFFCGLKKGAKLQRPGLDMGGLTAFPAKGRA